LYHAWQPIIYQLLGIGVVAGSVTERSAMVLKRLGERHPDLVATAPLLGDALSIDVPDNVTTQHITGKARGERTREIVRQLFQREVQREPIVLVLEDIHWLDSASWKLLTELLRSVQPMLTILTSRAPESTDDNYRLIHSLSETTRLVLDRLSRDDVAQLLYSALGVEQIPELLAETIHRKADGNPLFTEQLIMVIRDRLKEANANGATPTRFDDLDTTALEFPDTLHGLITGRIDRLPPSPQLTIKVASVIGRRFSYDALHDNYPVATDQIQLRESIGVGLQSGLIEVNIPGPPAAYQFQHAIAHEAAYSLLLFHQRQQLHRSIAEWYESTGQQEIASNQPLLAYHWHRGGDEARAVSYFERSGDAALRNGAYAEAANFFREAVQTDAKGTEHATNLRRATWHRKLAESHLGLGQLVDCQAALETALRLLGRVPPPTLPRLIANVSRLAVVQLRRRLSHRKYRQSQTPDPNATSSLEAARCYERLAEIYYLSNDRARLVHAILSSLNLAECDGPTPELARAYANSCFAAGLAGLHPLARAYAENAHEVAAIAGDPTATAWVLEATGIYCLAMGKCDEAQSRFEPAIELCKQIGDWQHWGESMASSAQAAYFRGDFLRGFETWSDLYDRAKSRGDDLQKAWGLNGRAEGFLRLGGKEHAEFAAASLDESLKLLAQNVDRVSRFGAYGLMALTQLRRGDLIAARRTADEGMRLAVELAAPTGYYSLNGYYGVARTYLALWKDAPRTDTKLPKIALRACQALRRYARVFPVGRPSFMQCDGLALWLSGKQKRAIAAWRKGLIAAQRMRLPYAEGLLHYELARHLPATHVDRQNHIDAARGQFKLLDADFDLEASCLLSSPTQQTA
jgi:hypothetical protein